MIPARSVTSQSPSLFGDGVPVAVDLDAEERLDGVVEDIVLERLVLDVDAASPTPTFDWLEEVRVWVESVRADSALPRVEIVRVDVPPGVTEIDRSSNDCASLLPYVREGARFTSVEIARGPLDRAVIHGIIVYRVTAHAPPCRALGAGHRC